MKFTISVLSLELFFSAVFRCQINIIDLYYGTGCHLLAFLSLYVIVISILYLRWLISSLLCGECLACNQFYNNIYVSSVWPVVATIMLNIILAQCLSNTGLCSIYDIKAVLVTYSYCLYWYWSSLYAVIRVFYKIMTSYSITLYTTHCQHT